MIEERDWEEFRDSGLLWWINMILHTFGWAIVFQYNIAGGLNRVYPAKVRFRGFDEDVNTEGYQKVSKYLKDNIEEINEAIDK